MVLSINTMKFGRSTTGLPGGGKLDFGQAFYGFSPGFLLVGNGEGVNSGDLAGPGLGGFGFQFFGLFPG